MRVPLLVAFTVLLGACDLYFPDHRFEIAGRVTTADGRGVEDVVVTLRRGRFYYDTPLATTQPATSGAYRLTHHVGGCLETFDHFVVQAERIVGADTSRAREPVECVDGPQTVDLALP